MADEAEKQGGALTKFMGGGAMATLDPAAQAQALMESADAGSSGSGDVVYLSYSGKMDKYAMGRDKNSPDPDAVYVVDPMSMVEGWVCWKGGSPVEKHEWSVYERATQAIPASQLKDHGPYGDGDGWSFLMGFSMFDTDDPSQQIKFTTSSKSGRNVFSDMNKEIATRLAKKEPHVPVIVLESEKFTADGKVNGKPKFLFEGWVKPGEVFRFAELGDDADLEDLLSGNYDAPEAEAEAGEPDPEPKPAATGKGRGRRARRAA